MAFRSRLPPDLAPHLSPARRPYSRSALPGQNSPQRVYWCRRPQTQSRMPVQPEFRLLHSTDVVVVSGVRVSSRGCCGLSWRTPSHLPTVDTVKIMKVLYLPASIPLISAKSCGSFFGSGDCPVKLLALFGRRNVTEANRTARP